MAYLVDTNVISESTKIRPNVFVEQWMNEHGDQYYLSSVTIGEIRRGTERLPTGERKVLLLNWLTQLCESKRGRILNFKASTAHVWGQHMAIWQKKGINVALLDSFIAATALRHQLTLVTRNVSDFSNLGLRIVNPFDS